MNKLNQLRRRLVRDVGVALGIAAGFALFMLLTDTLADGALEKKTAAAAALSQDQSQLTNLNKQFDKSGEAEKRFVGIAAAHLNQEYAADSDAMKNLLREYKDHYRLADNFKLNLALEKNPGRPEFIGLNYDITIREPMRIEFEAMSDTHVFSFIQRLVSGSPGLVRITRLEMKRTGDLDAGSLNKMNGGEMLSLVTASVEFSWIGVAPKKAGGSASNAKPAEGGGQ